MRDTSAAVLKEFREVAMITSGWTVEPVNYEGLRVAVGGEVDGWCMLRPSLHEPILSIQMESNVKGGCSNISEVLFDRFSKLSSILDVGPLQLSARLSTTS